MLKCSLTNQSVCCSKNITVKAFAIEMILYDDLEALTTEGYQCIVHLASGKKSVTLRSIDYLTEMSIRKKKENKVFW